MARAPRSIADYFSLDAPFVNEFRRLLLMVKNRSQGKDIKSLLVTSAMLSEGKSTTCSLFGLTAAKQDGLKTLIIDTDLRRPAIHDFFLLDRQPGLVDILTEGFSGREAIQKTDVDKLDIITAGSYHPEPASVFDAAAIGFLIDDLKFYYDLILIDCAPLLPVSDPLMLSSLTDAVLLVVRAGQTNREVVARAVEILGEQKDRILGVVLNNANNCLPYFYNYSYYGYQIKKPRPTRRTSSAGKSIGTNQSSGKADLPKGAERTDLPQKEKGTDD